MQRGMYTWYSSASILRIERLVPTNHPNQKWSYSVFKKLSKTDHFEHYSVVDVHYNTNVTKLPTIADYSIDLYPPGLGPLILRLIDIHPPSTIQQPIPLHFIP